MKKFDAIKTEWDNLDLIKIFEVPVIDKRTNSVFRMVLIAILSFVIIFVLFYCKYVVLVEF